MKIQALDQISISAVKSDSLRPGEVFEVNDAYGAVLVQTHPTKFRELAAGEEAPPAVAAEAVEKAEAAPLNKAEPAPANKADKRRKRGK